MALSAEQPRRLVHLYRRRYPEAAIAGTDWLVSTVSREFQIVTGPGADRIEVISAEKLVELLFEADGVIVW